MDLSDDDYEHVSDMDMCDSDDEIPPKPLESAPSSPPSVRNLNSSNRKQQSCPYDHCQKTFTRKSRLAEHVRSHQNVRLFKCAHGGCDKEYLRQSHLNHHTKSAHSDIRDYKCTWEDCDKSFATGTRLRRHIQAHEGREKFRCRGYPGCGETFRKHETLKKHILSVHQQMQPYNCTQIDARTGEQCTRAFETMAKLKTHQQTMHDATRFSCTDCLANTAANLPGGLQANHQVTSGCFFATYSELQAHIVEVHPPTCHVCPTSFSTLKELNRHLELQHGYIDPNLPKDSTFACAFPDCDRTFTKKGNLNVHIRTVHQKKKDFVCGATSVPVPEELAGEQGVEIYGCGREFTTKQSLEDHIRSAHFGLETKLLERRKKRTAEMAASRESNNEREAPRLKKTRKDKGIKKASAFAGLTGIPAAQNFPTQPSSLSHSIAPRSPFKVHDGLEEISPVKVEDEADQDEWNQLSGSMVLFGSHLYHNGQQYTYQSNHDPAGPSSPQASNQYPDFESDLPQRTSYLTNFEDEPVFDNFEHEPEFMNGLHVDPVLLQS